MAKKKIDKEEELTLEESLLAVKRIAKSNKLNEELDLLKKASATLAKELKPELEFEEDEGSGGASVTEELTKPPGFFEQLGATAQALGPAGLIALSSAAYFQIDTVVEETRTVATVAEEKWEEVKFEHPNINWDDPLAGFTTILGVGDIEIDLEPPEPKQSTSSSVTPKSGEKTDETETAVEETESEIEETETESEAEETDEQEEKPKKKKGLFGLFGGDDEESEEEAEEVEEETEAKEESSEPEPEAEEEQVKEKPKKKSGGLFSAFFGGGDDEESEEPEDENREEPTQDDQVPEEQKDETEVDEPETKEVAKTTTNDSNKSSVGITVEKKSSGGLLSLFGFNSNEEEVVEESEISTDEEPVIEVAVAESDSEAPQISEEVTVEAKVDVAEVPDVELEVVATDSGETFEINLSEMSEMDIEFIAEAIDNGQLEVANLNIDDVVEETVAEVVIEKVVTPIDTGNGEVNVVSPAGPAGDLIWADIFGPNAPGRLSDSESDATPI